MAYKKVEIRKVKQKEMFLEHIKKVPIIQICAEKVNLNRSTFYRWYKSDRKFAKAVDLAIQEGVSMINDLAQSQIIQAMKERNLTACMYWLNHKSQDFANKLQVSGNLEMKKDELTKEQEKDIKRALELASMITRNEGRNEKKQ
jgi:hypothetical protein